MQNARDDELIMALTGLAGGILNNGSTCGVVIGGAISTAMIRDKELDGKWNLEEEVLLLDEVRENVLWFENEFKTSLCRERDDLNYQRITTLGLLNPKKAKGCVTRSGASMERFVRMYEDASPRPQTRSKQNFKKCTHCAKKILQEVRQKTDIGNDKVERVSVALDGGIGLTGGGCGALSGALMALGLKFALNPKNTDPNKLKNIYRAMDSEFFNKAKLLVNDFIKNFGYLECARLTGTPFKDWSAFCDFRNQQNCTEIDNFLISKTVEIINQKKQER